MAPEQGPSGKQEMSENLKDNVINAENNIENVVVRTGWIYRLQKSELEKCARDFGVDHNGTVNEVRKKLATFLSSGFCSSEIKKRAIEYEKRYQNECTSADHVACEMDSAPSVCDREELYRVGPSTSQQAMRANSSECAWHNDNFEQIDRTQNFNNYRNFDSGNNIRERVQKWGLSCDGTHDVLDFVEQVEDLAKIDRVQIDSVHQVLSGCLTGDALMWWRARHTTFNDWRSFRTSFLKFFLDPNFWDNLEDQIRQRKQKPGESFKRYALVMENMMRHTNMSAYEKLVRIHKNASPLVRMWLEPEQLTTLDQLTAKASYIELASGGEFGEIERLMVHQEPTRAPSHNISGRHNRQFGGTFEPHEACRRCGQSGHFSRNCRNPEVLFCWTCGQKGRHTRNCCGHRNQNANENRANKPRLGGVKVVSARNLKTDSSSLFIGPPHIKNGTIAVMVKIDSREYPGIIDTGAGNSFVSTEAFQQMPKEIRNRLKRVKTTVSLADGAKAGRQTLLFFSSASLCEKVQVIISAVPVRNLTRASQSGQQQQQQQQP